MSDFVLWGYKEAYGPVPIKLSGANTVRALRREQRLRDAEGFLTYIYRGGTEPVGLRMQVEQLRARSGHHE